MDLRRQWYTTVEVAAMLGRSDRFVRDRIKEGKLSAVTSGGPQRLSYKISQEAVAGFLMAEGSPISKVSEQFKRVGIEYLQDIGDGLWSELRQRRGNHVKIVGKCEAVGKPVYELMWRNLAKEFLYGEAAYWPYFKNNALLMAVAFDPKANYAEGVLTATLTSGDFFEALKRGEVRDDWQPGWKRGQTPVLYIDCLIVEDPVWAYFLVRELTTQVREFCKKNRIELAGSFSVASAKNAEAMLLRYGFKEVGLYEDKYPIMLCKDMKTGKLGGYLR